MLGLEPVSLASLQDWEWIMGLAELPFLILGLIRSQRQRVAMCAGDAWGSSSLLGPCLDLVTWLDWKGLWAD